MADRTVLITGASGLLGTWLLQAVPDSWSVVALVHRTPVVGSSTVRADLRDAAAVTAAFGRVRPSLVVHAASAQDEASIIDATQNVARAAREVGAWHLPGPETITRYEIAKRVAAALELDERAVLGVGTPVHATRPLHINMQDSRAKAQIAWSPSRVLSPLPLG